MHVVDLLDPIASVAVTALVNGLWQGLLVLGLVWGVVQVVETRWPLNATTRYAVWALTLAVIVCLPVGAGLMAETLPAAQPAPVHDEAVVVLPEEAIAPVPLPGEAAVKEAQTLTLAEEREVVEAPVEVSVSEATTVEYEPAPATSSVVWRRALPFSMGRWMPFLFGIWVIGVVVLALRVGYGCLHVRRLKKSSIALPPVYQHRLDMWRRKHGLRRPVQIASLADWPIPVAVGLRRPMILVPAGLLDTLTEAEFDQVMLHELAHLQRRDDWTNLFQKIAQALLFFHPAVYWLGQQMEREREMACDDWVVSLTRQPKSYASCLTRLVELKVRSRVALVAPGMAVGKEHLFERVGRLLDQQCQATAGLYRTGFLTVMLSLVAAVLLIALAAPFFTPSQPAEVVAAEPILVVSTEAAVVALDEPTPVVVVEPVVRVKAAEPVVVPEAVVVIEPVVVAVEGVDAVAPLALHATNAGMQDAQPRLRQARAERADLSVASWVRVLKASAGIASSSDRMRFLTDAASRMPANEAVYAAYLGAVSTISISGDRHRALLTLLNHHHPGQTSMLLLLEVTESITTSGDRARVLIEIAPMLPRDDTVRDAYLAVVQSLSSSSDYDRVLAALMRTQR